MIGFWWLVVLGIFALLLSSADGRKLLQFAFLTPFFAFTIWLDRRFPSLTAPFVGFPRRPSEILAQPQLLFNLLKKRNKLFRQGPHMSSRIPSIPADATFVRLEREGRLEAEPDKETSILKAVVVYRDGQGAEQSIPIFCKTSSERGVTHMLRAIIATFNPFHKEVQFCRELASEVPMDVPAPLLAEYSRFFGRNLTVSVTIPPPFAVTPDWRGASFHQTKAMVLAAARLHGQYWRPSASVVPWLHERNGLDFLSGAMSLCFKKSDASEWAQLWFGLEAFFKRPVGKTLPPVCLSHADFRPGNMLFDSPDSPNVKAIFADWEAISIAPFMWDFTYCTVVGQKPAERRERHNELMNEYRLALLDARVDAKTEAPHFSTERCELHFTALSIVIYYFGWMLQQMGGVGKAQGNSESDCNCWAERIERAILERTTDLDKLSTDLGIEKRLLSYIRFEVEKSLAKLEPERKKEN